VSTAPEEAPASQGAKSRATASGLQSQARPQAVINVAHDARGRLMPSASSRCRNETPASAKAHQPSRRGKPVGTTGRGGADPAPGTCRAPPMTPVDAVPARCASPGSRQKRTPRSMPAHLDLRTARRDQRQIWIGGSDLGNLRDRSFTCYAC